MKKVARIISTVALIATLSAPAWAEGIGDNMSIYAQTVQPGQVGATMRDATSNNYQWGKNFNTPGAAQGGVPAVQLVSGSQLEDLLTEMGL